jgi:hypothetical protein
MQLLDAEPTEAQLAVLLAPEEQGYSLKIEETSEELRISPRGYPLVACACWMLLILAVMAGLAIYKDESQMLLVMLPIAIMASFGVLLVIGVMNSKMAAGGDFVVVDKKNRTLALPRHKIVLKASQIRFFSELHAWHTWDRGRESQWVSELSVVAAHDGGELVRYPVSTCDDSRATGRAAAKLAELFSVEQRYLKLNWKTRRRLRRISTTDRTDNTDRNTKS